MLADGTVDIAMTYNAAAEKQSLDSGAAVSSVYAWRVSSCCLYNVRLPTFV